MQKQLTPCLWFDNRAQEAAAFYCKHLANTQIRSQSPIVTEISVSGQNVVLLDGGPKYQPNASISFFYICEGNENIDEIWKAFAKDGEVLMPLDKYDWADRYGWVNDKYGISWQFSTGKIEDVGQKLTPCLMFTGKQYGRAEEAMNHYASIFGDFKLDGILRFGENEQPDEPGKVKHAQLSLDGNKFMFMDSAQAHNVNFSEGVSLTIHCDTQEEIDYYWEHLTEDGQESMCGWLKDKFGVSWQVVPNIINQLMSDPAKAGKAAKAFMEMRKFDIEKIVQASLA
jgi:predicted 3-demethylubiquinone-9 3-methyltransferase (glyoxalase superfamily)